MKKQKSPGKYARSLRTLASRLGRDKGSVARKMKQPGAPKRTARGYNVAAAEAWLARDDAEFSRLRNERWALRNQRERIALGRETKDYLPREQVLREVTTANAQLHHLLKTKLREVAIKLQGLDVWATEERLLGVLDDCCLIIQSRPGLWTKPEEQPENKVNP
ncbi:MAG TPA: hypothetical protein VHI52_01085 [Verrucomicrobiae bacterium]|nr:hypothetical protein [Verrucomicrobiae bacterium]